MVEDVLRALHPKKAPPRFGGGLNASKPYLSKMTPTVWLPPIFTVQLAVVAIAGIGAVGAQFEEKPINTPEVAVAVSVTVEP